VIADDGGEIPTVRSPAPVRTDWANFPHLAIIPPASTNGAQTPDEGETVFYLFVSGTGRMMVNNEEFEVGPGDVVVNLLGGTPGVRNTGQTTVRLAVIELTGQSGWSRTAAET